MVETGVANGLPCSILSSRLIEIQYITKVIIQIIHISFLFSFTGFFPFSPFYNL